jgi:hypothetical protein
MTRFAATHTSASGWNEFAATSPGASGCNATPAAQVRLKPWSAWRDGTAHLVMSPLEFTQRLTAMA